MKLCIIGYGKMGQVVARLAPLYGCIEMVIVDNETDWLQKQNEIKTCDVAIEFSTPQTVLANLTKCFEMQLPVVSGTTGWNDQKEAFLQPWCNMPLAFIYGSNFSIGANIFFKLNEYLAKQMSAQPQYSASIEETHHIHKKDIPSGTALSIEKAIVSQFNVQTNIPIVSHREGETVGEHIVHYQSHEDVIQIKHSALTRDAFAHGALKAAVWLLKNRGVYAFEDIFGEV